MNDPRFPPIPAGGRVLQIPESAAEAMRNEVIKKVQPHLNELNQENAAEQSAIALVFGAAIKAHGVALVNGDLFSECLALAKKLSDLNLNRSHTKAQELFLEMNLTDIPLHIVRAAKRSGVTMPTPGAPNTILAPTAQ